MTVNNNHPLTPQETKQAVSSYIVGHEPNKYGGKQVDYAKRAQEIISKTTKSFKEEAKQGANLEDLFFATLDTLASERHKLAEDHQTENSQNFGIRRDQTFKQSVTSLTGPYSEYNKKLIAKLSPNLSKLNVNGIGQMDSLTLPEEIALNRKSKLEYKLYSREHPHVSFKPNFKNYQAICAACKNDETPPCSKKQFKISMFETLLANPKNVLNLQLSNPMLYEQVSMSIKVDILKNTFQEWMAPLWVQVTHFLEIDSKMHELSQYITWKYPRVNPLENPWDYSTFTIFHQNSLLVQPMLNAVAKIFKEAIEWDGKDIKSLKDRVILFEYLLAHAMPYKRGSAAIGEWLITAIYNFHGFSIEYKPGTMTNLEALTSTLGEFAASYDSTVELKKIQAS